LDKLGVKPNLRIKLIGEFDPAFRAELEAVPAEFTGPRAKSGLVFFAATAVKDLDRIPALMKTMERDGALWIVYPKGVTAIREIDVIQAGRAAGLKDVKVASFSASHTALKFVVPVAAR
jgi:hypothetical protein